MKKLLRIFVIVAIASLNCYTSCEEDECEETKINGMTVDVYAWGYFAVYDNDMNDIVANYPGTHFSIKYYKNYCGDKKGEVFGFDYLSLANGDLDKQGVGNYSFTMTNEKDEIIFLCYYYDENGTSFLLDEQVITYGSWKPGNVRCEVWIEAYANAGESINPYALGVNWIFKPLQLAI